MQKAINRRELEPWLYSFRVELTDKLLAPVENYEAESILSENGLAEQLKKILAELTLSAKLSHKLSNEAKTAKIIAMAQPEAGMFGKIKIVE